MYGGHCGKQIDDDSRFRAGAQRITRWCHHLLLVRVMPQWTPGQHALQAPL